MSALVLSLLVASAKSAFDTRSQPAYLQASADMILLDRALARYGSEDKGGAAMLKSSSGPDCTLWPRREGVLQAD